MVFQQLLSRWYPNGTVFDSTNDVAAPYRTNSDSNAFYKNVVARSCRTCHVAMDQANFEIETPPGTVQDLACGRGLAELTFNPTRYEGSYLMPNSRVTFDRFWLSGRKFVTGQPANTPNQSAIPSKFYSLSCHLP